VSISAGSYFWRDANGIRTDMYIGVGRASAVPGSYGVAVADSMDAGTGVQGQTWVATTRVQIAPGSAPASTEGYVYYDSTAHKLKVRGAAGYETVTSV